jgi:hypothetical protein
MGVVQNDAIRRVIALVKMEFYPKIIVVDAVAAIEDIT